MTFVHSLGFVILAVSLILSGAVAEAGDAKGETLSAAEKSDILLQLAIQAANLYPTAGDMITIAKRSEDQKYLRDVLGEKASLPIRLQFIQPRGMVVHFAGEQVNVSVKDISKAQFSLFKRDFIFDPSESAESAVARLSRMFAANSAHQTFPSRLLEPEARAIAPLVWAAASAYVSIAVVVGTTCSEANVNSVKVCSEMGALWPLAPYYLGYKLLEQKVEKVSLTFSSTKFNLQDVVCAPDGMVVKATVLDSYNQPVLIEIDSNKSGDPQKITFKNSKGDRHSITLANGWREDLSGNTVLQSTYHYFIEDPWNNDMAIRGARQIRQACMNGDSKAALARYRREHEGAAVLAPKVDRNGVSIKAIQ